MAHDHSHHQPGSGNERSLRWALVLTAAFVVAEVIGGLVSGSLALISDAAHMFTDAAALAIALAAIRIGKRPADSRRTFGYYRLEILAAAFNAILLFGVAIYIIVEAYQRLRQPAEIGSTMMLVIAAIGLLVNLISMRLLSGGRDTSLNVKGAYLEVWSDMLGSVGVIAAALVIRFTGWSWVDSAIAVAIGLWVVPRTWRLLRESMNVLLEGVPEGIGMTELEQALGAVPGVASIHDLHVWSISSGKVSLTVHVVCDPAVAEAFELLVRMRLMLAERFDIHHATLQLEREPCEQAAGVHGFGPVVPHMRQRVRRLPAERKRSCAGADSEKPEAKGTFKAAAGTKASMTWQAILAVALLVFSSAAFASCANDDHTKAPLEGGVVRETKDAHYELVAKPDVLHLYIREHGRPIDLFEMQATITLLAGKKKQVVDLKPLHGRLEANGSFQVGRGTKVVAMVTRPGKPAATVRFTLQ